MFISPSDPRLIYCGRIDFDNPDAPVMVYPSSYVTFRFTGNFLKVKLTNKRSCWSNRMGCVIDGVQTALLLYEDNEEQDRKSTRLNSSHNRESRMPSSA